MAPSPRIREAIGVFADSQALETAVSDLQSHGFDRAEISFISGAALEKSGTDDPGAIARDPAADRHAGVSDTDIRQGRTLGVSLAATIAGFAAAGFAVATGGTAVIAAAAAALAVGGVAAVGELVGQAAPMVTSSFLDAELLRGGVLLVVRLYGDAAERRALDVLRRHSRHVVVHDVPVTL